MDKARDRNNARLARKRYEAELRDEYLKKNSTQAVVRTNEPRTDGEETVTAAVVNDREDRHEALVQNPHLLPPQHKKHVHWSNEPTVIPNNPGTITNNNTATNVAMSDALVVNGPTNIESFTVNHYNGGKDRTGNDETARAGPHPILNVLENPVFWWLVAGAAVFGTLYWLISGVRDVVSGAGGAVLGAGTSVVATAISLGAWLLATAGLGETPRTAPARSSHASKTAASIKPLVNHLPEIIAVVEWSESAAHAVSDTAGYDVAGMVEMCQLETMAETLRERHRVTNEEWTDDVREQKAAAWGLITQFQDLKTDAETAKESSQMRCWIPWFRKPAFCTVHERALMRTEQAAELVKATGGLWRRRIAEDDAGGGVLDQTPAEARKVCQHSGGLQIAQSQMKQRLLDGKAGGSEPEEVAQLHRGLMLIEDQDQGLRMACHVANNIAREAKDVRKSLKRDVDEMRVMGNGLLMTRQSAEDGDIDDVIAAGRVLDHLDQFVAMLERWEVDE